MKYIVLFLWGVAACTAGQGRLAFNIYGIGTTWDDSFKSWVIYTGDEDVKGTLEARWAVNDDWSEWDYRIGEESGSIKRKWHDDFSQWELRANNEIITMKTKWNNDFTEWRVSDGTITLDLNSEYKTHRESWKVKHATHGTFEMYTTYEQDLRDWEVYDELGGDISAEMRMALVFTVMFCSTPKH